MSRKTIDEKTFWAYMEAGMGVFFKVRELMAIDGVDMSRQAMYGRCNSSKENKARLQEIRTAIIDKAEQTMVSLLDSKDPKIKKDAAKFVLETLGKDSGYSKRVQHTDGNDEPLSIKVEIVD